MLWEVVPDVEEVLWKPEGRKYWSSLCLAEGR